MPFVRRRRLEELVTERTAALERRLQEAERRLTGHDAAASLLDHRLTQSDTVSAAERLRSHARVEELTLRADTTSTVITGLADRAVGLEDRTNALDTAMAQHRREVERRLAFLEEELAAQGRRSAEDQARLEAALADVGDTVRDKSDRLEHRVRELVDRLDSGVDVAPTRTEVKAVANELARLTIDLRAELASAVEHVLRSTRANGRVIDLTTDHAGFAPPSPESALEPDESLDGFATR